jgi:hypothetical protein
MRARNVAVAALTLAAQAASAEDLQLQTPPPEVAPQVDVYGRLLATPDRELFQLGRVRLEFRAAGGSATIAEPFCPPAAVPHEDRMWFNMDARATNFLVRFPLAPAGARAPSPALP